MTQLSQRIKQTLEAAFPGVWVSGELSNVARPQSGHVYLTLKDEASQVRGVIWRSAAARVPFELKDGQQVVCFGEIDVYPPRGVYQLIIRQIQPLGIGSLQLALRQLQQRLAAEGLFAAEHKQPLPRFPRRIALVTSPTGAAVRDFLEVLRRRWRGAHVLVIPARVQGEGAADEIVRGIQAANRLQPPPDVLVVGRGGGSLEDLWCFNEEPVVRAIFASRIPVVSAVGHEIDVTLSDLAADVRALTPSEAAERVVPSAEELVTALAVSRRRIAAALRSRAADARARFESLERHAAFRRPFDLVRERARQLDELDVRGLRALGQRSVRCREQCKALAAQLESLSPLSVLARGYSLTSRAEEERLLTDSAEVAPGDRIRSRLARGALLSRVEQID